jgi:hypothetical protein
VRNQSLAVPTLFPLLDRTALCNRARPTGVFLGAPPGWLSLIPHLPPQCRLRELPPGWIKRLLTSRHGKTAVRNFIERHWLAITEVLLAATGASAVAHYLEGMVMNNSYDHPSTAPVFLGVVVLLSGGMIWKSKWAPPSGGGTPP